MNKVKKTNQQPVFWICLIVLLILRIPLDSWMEYLAPSSAAWITPLYEIGTYGLIAFLIWWERENLKEHHIDPLAILVIIFLKPVSILLLPLWGNSASPLALPKVSGFVILLIAIGLLVFVLRNKISLKVDRQAVFWFFFGSAAGIILAVLQGVVMIGFLDYPIPPNPGISALAAPLYQLGYAAVSEEPLFRGFLWGGLKRAGMRDAWILLVQAVLFTAAHIHLLDTAQPLLFLGITFFNALIFGFMVWRSRRLSSSLAMHGFFNGSVIFQYWIYLLVFR